MVDNFSVSVARVARKVDIWFTGIYTDIIMQYNCAKVFPVRAVDRGGFKHEHELKVTFLFNFLRLSKEFDTLEKNR